MVWRDIEHAFEREGAIEGTIVGKVKGGLKVDIGVPAFLPGSHVDIRPARNLDRYIGQSGSSRSQVQQDARQHRRVAPRGARARADGAQGRDAQGARRGRHPRGHGQERHRLRRVRRPRRHRRPAARHRHVVGPRRPPVRGLQRRRPGEGRRPQVRSRARARVARHEADQARPVAHGRRAATRPAAAYAARSSASPTTAPSSSSSRASRVWSTSPRCPGPSGSSTPRRCSRSGQEVEVAGPRRRPGQPRISLGLKQTEPNPWEMVRIKHPVGSRIKAR